MSTSNKILVILGPTSSGKSDIAIKLAKKFNGEIISADSRQVYRGMDVGTGKIERDSTSLSLRGAKRRSNLEQCKKRQDCFATLAMTNVYMSHKIPHYMIDIISPQTEYNVAKFKKQAERIIENILKRGKLPIICGGTGFWIKAIVDNVNFPEVKPDWKLRKKLEKYPAEKLFAMLKKMDSEHACTIDAKNKVRLIRAIEICKAIKKVPALPAIPSGFRHRVGESRGISEISPLPRRSVGVGRNDKWAFLQIGIKLSKEKLHQNIGKRVVQRFKQGMIKEVENLHKAGLSWKKIQSFGLAYFWIPLYLQNEIFKEELFEKIFQAEKNYAKRQMTWFRRDKRIKWLKSYKEIEKASKTFLK